MKKKDFTFVVCFVAALAIGGIVTVTAGHREYSDNENRYLTQFPKLVPEDVMTGEVQQELTDAFNDQFPGRDWLTALSTTVKKGIGMKDVGGVYLGKDHYYFEKIMNQNISRTDYFQNLRFVNRLASLSKDAEVTALLVPLPGQILKDKLPEHASLYDADAMYKTAKETLQNVKLVDIRKDMKEARKQQKGAGVQTSGETQVYYRTDHHWTQYGAYVGYKAYTESVGRKAASYKSFDIKEFSDAFYGTLYSKALDSDAVPDTIELPEKLPEAEITCDGKEIDAVYDTAKKNEKDKYAVYFGGNYGEVDIRMKNPDNDRTLVIFKDSFANSMVPFLMKDYAQIRMIDLRYFKRSVSNYMEENPADEVLVLYEMSSFAQADKLNKLMK
ncbi:MAG: hypothetical protein KHW89_03665 [Roseburia sp.]|nr:hypothetical protein [Roseburia sp.]